MISPRPNDNPTIPGCLIVLLLLLGPLGWVFLLFLLFVTILQPPEIED